MNLSLIKIRSIFPTFNEKPITTEEFWAAAGKFKELSVHQVPLMVDGYYTPRCGRHFILINDKLTGVRFMHTALHEFYHYMFDMPGINEGYTFYRNGKYHDRREYKADAFATIGILPWPELLRIDASDVDDQPWLAEMVRSRIVVRTHFGL